MDGPSALYAADAIASILITSINIIAGFLIGVLQHGMDMATTADVHVLTIGLRLVTYPARDLDLGRPDP